MEVTIAFPDDFAARFGSAAELGRRALEALAVAEYRAGGLTRAELRRLLGLQTHAELDGFLKARDIVEPYTLADLNRDLQNLRLGSEPPASRSGGCHDLGRVAARRASE